MSVLSLILRSIGHRQRGHRIGERVAARQLEHDGSGCSGVPLDRISMSGSTARTR
jgi:hypothetical protein